MLLYSLAKEVPGLRLIPLGVKEGRYWRLRWLRDYSFSNLNSKTLPIAAMSTIQYVWALERIIREVVIYDIALVLVHVLKADVSDGLYHIVLLLTESPNLEIFFCSEL